MTTPVTYLDDDSGKIQLYPDWCENSGVLFQTLTCDVDWQSRQIQLFGKYHWIPRKEAWIAESGVRYTYSRQSYAGTGWHPALEQIAERLEQQFNWVSNGALLNYYRDGSDKMGWHSDNEPELGQYPNIAILSLGSTRQLQFRQTAEPSEKLKIDLPNGSLLWITGKTQSHWQHSLPKRAQREARISCTFRKVIR